MCKRTVSRVGFKFVYQPNSHFTVCCNVELLLVDPATRETEDIIGLIGEANFVRTVGTDPGLGCVTVIV
jgi:hypothetical protein